MECRVPHAIDVITIPFVPGDRTTWARAELLGASPLVHARVAGILGVLMLASGTFTGRVGSRLVLRDNLLATSGNILASQTLFRLGIAGCLVMMITWLFYALLLNRLLKPVNGSLALIMLALVLVATPIYMINQVNHYAILVLASGGHVEQMTLFLDLHRFGNLIAAIFFGLWLFPLGLLVFRSGYFPRFLGILLMLGSLGYLVLFVQAFFFPGSERTLWTNPFLLITHASELTMMLWLLVRGLNVFQWEERVLASAPT